MSNESPGVSEKDKEKGGNTFSLFSGWGASQAPPTATVQQTSKKVDKNMEVDLVVSPIQSPVSSPVSSARRNKCYVCKDVVKDVSSKQVLKCFACKRHAHVNCINSNSVKHCINYLKDKENVFNMVTFVCMDCKAASTSGENLPPAVKLIEDELNDLKSHLVEKDEVIKQLKVEIKDLNRKITAGEDPSGNTPKRIRFQPLNLDLDETEMSLGNVSDVEVRSPDLPNTKILTMINAITGNINKLNDKFDKLFNQVTNSKNDTLAESSEATTSIGNKTNANANASTKLTNRNKKNTFANVVKENLPIQNQNEVNVANANVNATTKFVAKLKNTCLSEILTNRKIKDTQIRNISINIPNQEEKIKVLKLLNADELAKEVKITDITKKSKFNRVITCKDEVEAKKLDVILFRKYGDAVKSTQPINKFKAKVVNVIMGEYDSDELLTLLCEQNDLPNNLISVDRSYDIVRNKFTYTNLILNCNDLKTLKKVIDKKKLVLGFNNVKVYEYSNLQQCNKCCGFGHLAFNCRFKIACRWCASAHASNECTEKDNKSKCINCINGNKKSDNKVKTDHMATYDLCPYRINRLTELKKYLAGSKN